MMNLNARYCGHDESTANLALGTVRAYRLSSVGFVFSMTNEILTIINSEQGDNNEH